MKLTLCVIGLGQVGTSIGMALQKSRTKNLLCVGCDINNLLIQKAKKTSAFSRLSNRPTNEVRNADVVVLAIPVSQVILMLEMVQPHLRDEAVIVNFSGWPGLMGEKASTILQSKNFWCSITPTLNPDLFESQIHFQPDATLFENSLMLVSLAEDAPPAVVKIIDDLITLLGGKEYLVDPYEVDGFMTVAQLMPRLLSAAGLQTACGQPGWVDARRMAGLDFKEISTPLLNWLDEDNPGDYLSLTKSHAVRMLRDIQKVLKWYEEKINRGKSDDLNDLYHQLSVSFGDWLSRRRNNDWDHEPNKSGNKGRKLK